MKLVVKKTHMGRGVFAGESVRAGEVICIMSGKRVSAVEVDKLIESGALSIDDPFQVAENSFIILDPLPRYFNHSCNPNAAVTKGSAQGQKLVALCDIKKGDEVTYDYSSVVCVHCDWAMPCACGYVLCRGVAKNARSIPKNRLQKYVAQGALPAFIKKELSI